MIEFFFFLDLLTLSLIISVLLEIYSHFLEDTRKLLVSVNWYKFGDLSQCIFYYQ